MSTTDRLDDFAARAVALAADIRALATEQGRTPLAHDLASVATPVRMAALSLVGLAGLVAAESEQTGGGE